jgi:putative transcriptional regulator
MNKAKGERKYRSRLSAAIHESASGLYRIGLMDKAAMREFDATCLIAPAPSLDKQTGAIRKQAGVRQE